MTTERIAPDIAITQRDFEELRKDVSSSPLWNKDLAPTTIKERTWSTWNIAALWIGMSVVITTYTLAGGFIEAGMNWWQAMITILLGNTIVLILMILNAHAGTKYGVSFPVLCRKRDTILGARMRIEDHGNQNNRVSEENGDHRLPPVHACFNESSGQRVGGNNDAHSDPQRCDIPGRPGSLPNRGGRKISIPKRARRDVFVQLDEIARGLPLRNGGHTDVLRLRNRPFPALPLNIRPSTTTLPRTSTVSVTPQTVLPS